MKISAVETIILRYEMKNPVMDSLHTYDAGWNILCALNNAIYLESSSLKTRNDMLVTQLVMKDGEILLPDVPGMGTEVSEDYIEAHRT